MIGTFTAWTLPIFLSIITLLPLVRSDYWTFRILEYPRFQKLAIGLACLISLYGLRQHIPQEFPFLFGASVLCCVYLIFKIFPYTPLAQKEMLKARVADEGSAIRIFTANVLQTNRRFDRMLAQIHEADSDLVFLVETDEQWAKAVSGLKKSYPYTMQKPLDNTYGLLFFSRLPLRNNRVLFRTDPEVPSVEAEVQLPSGIWLKVFGLHPKPPVPGEALYSTAKDKELMKVAFEVEAEQNPCIVMGDLNDVAWSHVTQLFRKVSGLLDPRRGRGFYSTYSAENWLMRFPLDYIFCSQHFGLVQMKRMPYNCSDHFAMYIHLQYDPTLIKVQEAPEADNKELQEAAEKASQPVPREQ
jgi:endonuclease/exonuclease/phosphatase (EEP) superfamily protein YafD